MLEEQAKKFDEEYQQETKEAEDAAKDELDQAQKAFDKQVDQVKSRTDLDDRTKEILLTNLQEVAQRRLEVEKAKYRGREAEPRFAKARPTRNGRPGHREPRAVRWPP